METLLLALIVVFILVSTNQANFGTVDFVTLTVFGIAGIKLMPVAQQVYASMVSIKSNYSTTKSLIELHKN